MDLVNGSRLPLAESPVRGEGDLCCALFMDGRVPESLTRLDIAQPFHRMLLPREHGPARCTGVSIRELNGEGFILAPNSEEPCVRSFQLTNLAGAVYFGLLVRRQETHLALSAGQTPLIPQCGRALRPRAFLRAGKRIWAGKTESIRKRPGGRDRARREKERKPCQQGWKRCFRR